MDAVAQILEQVPHENLLDTVLNRALAKVSILELISLLPPALHPAALTAYAPSITRCHSLRLPHSELQPESSLLALTAAASFTSLTSLELFHCKAAHAVGPSDGISPIPANLQLPDTCLCQENHARRFWDSLKDSCIQPLVDSLVADLLQYASANFPGLQSLSLALTVVGCSATEALTAAFADGCWPKLNLICMSDCSAELNPLPSAQQRLNSAFEQAKRLHDRLSEHQKRSNCTEAGAAPQQVSMNSLPSMPEAIASVLCEGYKHQIEHPELYRCNKFTLRVVVSQNGLEKLYLYECNMTIKSMKTMGPLIACSTHLEAVHVCQSVMVFIREPLLQALVDQMSASTLTEASVAVAIADPTGPLLEAAKPQAFKGRESAVQAPQQHACSEHDSDREPDAPARKLLRVSKATFDRSLKELHILGHEYSENLDLEAVIQVSFPFPVHRYQSLNCSKPCWLFFETPHDVAVHACMHACMHSRLSISQMK
jgi:hypothetical protein